MIATLMISDIFRNRFLRDAWDGDHPWHRALAFIDPRDPVSIPRFQDWCDNSDKSSKRYRTSSIQQRSVFNLLSKVGDMDEESKLLSFILRVRVYGLKFDSSVSHSYLVDDVCSGTSAPIGEFHIDIRKTTLTQLRPMIQYDRSGHMDRRSMMFQEAQFIMRRLPNHYNRPPDQWNKYVFGFLRKDRDDLNQQVRLIEQSDEGRPIADLIGATEYFSVDLAIVPLTQIPILGTSKS